MGTPGKISHGTAGCFATHRKEGNVCLSACFEIPVDSMVGDSLVGETNLAHTPLSIQRYVMMTPVKWTSSTVADVGHIHVAGWIG